LVLSTAHEAPVSPALANIVCPWAPYSGDDGVDASAMKLSSVAWSRSVSPTVMLIGDGQRRPSFVVEAAVQRRACRGVMARGRLA